MSPRRNNFKLIFRHPRTALQLLLRGEWTTYVVVPWGSHAYERDIDLFRFQDDFSKNLFGCSWMPDDEYSVFTQFDQSLYLSHEKEFLHKYKCFYAVAKTICPERMIELGVHAGSSADAYLSAVPEAEYLGFDQFEASFHGVVHEVTGESWQPLKVAQRLFAKRGFKRYQLIETDLRSITQLPVSADLVVVDAAHDFENQFADLKLALTANPRFIFVDDTDMEDVVRAIEKFLDELDGKVDFYCGVPYIWGGLVIKLK